MDTQVKILGRLLLVPCVHDLLKENPTMVPKRYVRDDQEPPMDTHSGLPQVPVIDLGRLVSEDCAKPELKKLHHTCKDWGFFKVLRPGGSAFAEEDGACTDDAILLLS
ncbi:hypothetical protein NL676_008585 [Syzygium grande]|nr:hypothetical protein NL676_008585 [Syzygium grande]